MSHYHTSEEKPRLQIQKDRVLCLFFIRGRRGSGEVCDCTLALSDASTKTRWPNVANTGH